MSKWKSLAMAGLMAFGLSQLVACGVDAPSSKSIEEHILTPTGQVDAVSLVNAYQLTIPNMDRGNPVVPMPDRPTAQPPTGTTTQPLTAKRLLTISPQQALVNAGVPQPTTMWLRPSLLLKKQQANKGAKPAGGLVLKNIDNPMACMKDADLTSKNINITMEMGCLTEGEGTGTIQITTSNIGLADLSKEPEELNGQVSVRFNNACDNKGNCINGHYRMDLDVSKSNKRMNIVMAYNLKIKTAGKDIKSRGGVSVKMNAGSGDGQISIVTFVKDKEGREGSIVLQIAGDNNGGSFKVKGANGSFSCAVKGDGEGRCQATQGNESITWQL